MIRVLASILRELRHGACLAFGLGREPVSGAERAQAGAGLPGAVALLLLVELLVERLWTSGPVTLSLYGVQSGAARMLLLLLALVLCARILGPATPAGKGAPAPSRRASDLSPVVYALCLMVPLHALVSLWVLERLLPASGHDSSLAESVAWGLYLLLVAWTLLVVWWQGRPPPALTHPGVARRLLASLVFGVLLYGVPLSLPKDAVWVEPQTQAQAEVEPVVADIEAIYYAQPARVAHALGDLRAQTPGLTDVYFIGFANDANASVFLRDVRLAATVIDARLDTAGRSVLLVNHPSTVDQLPLANAPNLRAVLAGLGARMDPHEDVLFVYLTSHGSADGYIGARFGALRPNDLSAAQLREMLDASGIRWRVVIVSACFSGSFIEPLADPYTLVLSAAAKDRSSFGCGDEFEVTYFAEHLFQDALARGGSLLDAFERARASLSAREQAEGQIPSLPQRFVGEQMRDKLRSLRWRDPDAGRPRPGTEQVSSTPRPEPRPDGDG
ncbi:MAG: hypothetical protein KDK91_02205 [Gammaproteobacteria bacterium]|nr:hypothetical protein [Gammaproteobacteria bacterium]